VCLYFFCFKMKEWMKKNIWIIISVIWLFGLDLLTKYLFYDLALWSDLFFISQVFNTGISWWMPLPLGMIYFVGFLSLWLFIWMYKKKYISWVILSLLIAGTFGNLLDRILLGGVRDFIMIGSFPVFNVADMLLNIGVFLFLLEELKRWKVEKISSKK